MSDKIFKPMLACAYKGIDTFNPPYYVSKKLDGVRCVIIEGVAYSRQLLALPNKFLQAKCKELYETYPNFDWIDGEITTVDDTDELCFRKTNSITSSEFKSIEGLKFCAFDKVRADVSFQDRLAELQEIEDEIQDSFVEFIEQLYMEDIDEILEYEKEYLSIGGEGLILRSPDSPYKYGRSTLKQNYMLKLKRFQDSEAIIQNSVELMHNLNVATTDNLGNTKRSSHKSNKVASDMLGALVVKDIHTNVEFEIGTGFTEEQRKNLWATRYSLPGQYVKYKYFNVGGYDKPRHPVFLNFVNPIHINKEKK